ncbi:MAG: hypothetical protein IMW98_10350 [Firmicutes bacterium]|nr:hypothetical protein [Bacillota bacterium]
MRWGIGLAAAAGLAALLTAGGLFAARPVTLVSVWETEVGGDPVALPEAEPRPWTVDRDAGRLRAGELPAGWRWAPWIVVWQRDRFARTVTVQARSLWRLPARLAGPGGAAPGAPEVRLVSERAGGAVLVEAQGRQRWLAPGQSWSLAVVDGSLAQWSDGGAWREAVGRAILEGRRLTVWRVANEGAWPRAALAGGAGR